MRPGTRRFAIAVALASVALAGCDRKIEPFDPQEQPEQPDLSRIFPPGAERAAADAAGPMAAGRAPGVQPSGAAANGAPIEGVVRLAPGLESSVPAGATLFIIAHHGPGGGPPLAVKRVLSPRFPVAFRLGPEDRMIEAIPFAGPITVTARIDSDGDATSRGPGDMQGAAPAPVQPGQTGIEVVIGEPGTESAAGAMAAARTPGGQPSGAAASDAPIEGVVRLAPGLERSVPAGATLFIIARRGAGGGPPLAVKRIVSPRFPVAFRLGPEDRMIEAIPFAGPITVTARIDSDGDAMSRSPGDMQGAAPSPVQPGQTGIEVVVDDVL